MTRYGFRKFVSGTNRVAYTYLEDDRFIVKVAIDAIGLGDNPAEFKNQFLLKPFVTKVFEVSPCGTVGVFERVKPITNREEYVSICKDYYEILNTILGPYVLADIGTNFFMNVGLRYTDNGGWGPVILDFPYVYELDGNKLFCSAADPNTLSGRCDGIIDYDPGYNFLVCTKCGARYKAINLSKDIENNNVIVREKETRHMIKFSVSGGDHAVNETIKMGPDGKAKSIPEVSNMHVNGVNTVKRVDPYEEVVKNNPETANAVVKTVIKGEDSVEEVPVMETPVVEEKPVVEKKAPTSPVSFVSEEEKESSYDLIKKHIDEIIALSGLLTDDEAAKLEDDIEGLLVAVRRGGNNTEEEHLEAFKASVDTMSEEMDSIEDLYTEALTYEPLVKFINKYYTVKTDITNEELLVNADSTVLVYTGEEPKDSDVLFTIENTGTKVITLPEVSEEQLAALAEELDNDDIEDAAEEVVEVEEENAEDIFYNGITAVNGVVTNAKDIIPTENSAKIIALTDSDGNYIVDVNKNLIAIDTIDDKSFDALSIVSSSWLQQIQNSLTPDTEVLEEK
jgi:hypothetical protein